VQFLSNGQKSSVFREKTDEKAVYFDDFVNEKQYIFKRGGYTNVGI